MENFELRLEQIKSWTLEDKISVIRDGSDKSKNRVIIVIDTNRDRPGIKKKIEKYIKVLPYTTD